MAERPSSVTIEEIRGRAITPQGTPKERMDTGLNVASWLLDRGEPTTFLQDGVTGSNMPTAYGVNGKNIEHSLHWGIAIVDDGTSRKQVELPTKGKKAVRALRKEIYRRTQLKRWI